MTASPPTILVADDDDLFRHLLATVLSGAGYQVRLATNGADLVQLALAEPPDLVISDMVMPLLDGLAATEQLRAAPLTANIPVLIISAHPDVVSLARAAGADDALPKPLLLDQLLHRVSVLLRRT